jgi:protein involved in polysaccharide export with SLBB domain
MGPPESSRSLLKERITPFNKLYYRASKKFKAIPFPAQYPQAAPPPAWLDLGVIFSIPCSYDPLLGSFIDELGPPCFCHGRPRACRMKWIAGTVFLAFAICLLARQFLFPATAADLYLASDEYRLHLHDVVQIRVFNQSELDTTQEVRPDGGISLPFVGEVIAVGRSPGELDQIITDKYKKYLVAPEVAVIVREFNMDRVFMGGEVNQPGEVRFSGKLTLVQALFSSGGPRETASLSRCFVIHNLDTDTESKETFNVKEILENRLPDPALRPFDVVVVPEARISRIGRYVDQYVNRMVPKNFRVRLLEYYNLRPIQSNDVVGGIL